MHNIGFGKRLTVAEWCTAACNEYRLEQEMAPSSIFSQEIRSLRTEEDLCWIQLSIHLVQTLFPAQTTWRLLENLEAGHAGSVCPSATGIQRYNTSIPGSFWSWLIWNPWFYVLQRWRTCSLQTPSLHHPWPLVMLVAVSGSWSATNLRSPI